MSSPAARKKAYRRRQRTGRIVLLVEVEEHQIAAAMVAAGRLTDRQALCRAEIEREAAAIIAQWACSWASVPHG